MNISEPTLLLDEQKCRQNIQWMLEKSERLGVKLVPHFKTHQSIEIGKWFQESGIEAITVSSLKMAEFFAQGGWKDITVAFPVNVLAIDRINRILKMGVNLKLLIIDQEVVQQLDDATVGHVNLLIELDAGYNRTGVSTESEAEIQNLSDAISYAKHLSLYGLYCHPGNTYQANSIREIMEIWKGAIQKVNGVKRILIDKHPDIKIRMGDTPGCTVLEDMAGVDEIGPGNFVFYDLVMNYLSVCREDQIAVAMACPVVTKNADRLQIVIHGGGVHFSKDHLFDADEQKFFGEVVILQNHGWSPIIDGIKLISLSQEHGILKATKGVFDTIQIGDVLGVLPIHSCLTANLMKSYTSLTGTTIDHMEKNY